MRTKRARWASAMLAVSLCAIMATVGLMNIVDDAKAAVPMPMKPAPWSGVTIPVGHFFTSSAISTPYGAGYKITTNGSSDWSYHFIQVQNVPWLVGSAKCVIITGNFTQWDTFGSLAPTRRYIDAYVLSNDLTTVLGQCRLMDDRDETGVWHMRTAFISGLTAGTYVKIGIGKYDGWTNDWRLTVSMAGVTSSFPNAPAWPHEYLGPKTMVVRTGENFMALEHSPSTGSVYASAMTGHSGGLVTGVMMRDASNVMHYWVPGGTDFAIPTGTAFSAYSTGDGYINLDAGGGLMYRDSGTANKYSPVCLQTFTAQMYPAVGGPDRDTWVNSQYRDYWYSYGVKSQPPNMMPPVGGGGPGPSYMASDFRNMWKYANGDPFWSMWTSIAKLNATTQTWYVYEINYPETDFSIDLACTGLVVSIGWPSQIAYATWSPS